MSFLSSAARRFGIAGELLSFLMAVFRGVDECF